MPETISQEQEGADKGVEAGSHETRHELQRMTDEELLERLDDLRSGIMEPAKGPEEEAMDRACVAEARRRAYLLNEAADEAEKIITGKS